MAAKLFVSKPSCETDVMSLLLSEGRNPFSRGAYCLGKIVWGKGWEELIALLSQHTEARSQVLSEPLDVYGTGEAASEVWSATALYLNCRIRQATCRLQVCQGGGGVSASEL